MSVASHSMYDAIREAYESYWIGSSDFTEAAEVRLIIFLWCEVKSRIALLVRWNLTSINDTTWLLRFFKCVCWPIGCGRWLKTVFWWKRLMINTNNTHGVVSYSHLLSPHGLLVRRLFHANLKHDFLHGVTCQQPLLLHRLYCIFKQEGKKYLARHRSYSQVDL